MLKFFERCSFAIFLLLFIFLIFSTHAHAGYSINNNGWGTPLGACYTTATEACGAVVPPSGAVTHANGTVNGNNCITYQNSNNAQVGVVTISTACSLTCPAGQGRVNGFCTSCPAGQSQQADGSCGCPSGQVYDAPICHVPCASNQQWNSTLQQCEGPCTQSQYNSAVAANAAYQDKVTMSTGSITAGLRIVNEITSTSYTCISTCRTKVVQYVRIGTITNTNYELKDWKHWDVEHTGCDVMPAGSTQTTGTEIGRKPDGGCRSGFSYGEVNGTAGCYGAPSSGSSNDSGGGGPQNHPDNPGGSDGAGNNQSGQNQNGAGGACAAGYHDVNGVCVPDSNAGSGSGGGDSTSCTANDTRPECMTGMPEHTSGEADSFGEAVSNFADGLRDTPVAQTINGMSNLIPSTSGTCPAPGFDIFGQHFVIDMHCTLYESVAGVLSALMMVVWTFIGLRIIASA